jgi:hypothetical protein
MQGSQGRDVSEKTMPSKGIEGRLRRDKAITGEKYLLYQRTEKFASTPLRLSYNMRSHYLNP